MHSTASFGRFRRLTSVVVALLMIVALIPLSVGLAAPHTPVEYYVDAVSGSDTTGDGTAGNPWQSISKAMYAPAIYSGDTIWVAPGTYDDSIEPLFPIGMEPGVALKSTDGPDTTIVDAEGTDAVFSIVDATAGTQIEGLTITGGGTVNGGGIKISRIATGTVPVGWPKINGCIIQGNERDGYIGGGVSVRGSSVDATCAPLIEDCYIADNMANYGGGVGCYDYTALLLKDSTLERNVSKYAGGGVYLAQSFDAMIVACDLSSNETTDVGGALSTAATTLDSELLVDGCSISDNTAVGRSGGLYADNATVHVEATEFVSNTGGEDGGAMYFNGTVGYVTDCIVYDNYSGDDGGPMALNSGADITLTHCSIAGNDGADNAGIYNNGSTLDIYNSTIGNHDGDDILGPASVAFSNIEQTDVNGPGVIHQDPLMFDPANGDFRLRLGSPCIDTAGAMETDDDDIEGKIRPIDGDGDSVAAPDMGAWERTSLDVARYAGSTRYDTACQMAEAAFDTASTAIIASGEDFPDALSAAGLAGAYEAPLLLVKRTSVPSLVQSTLTNLGVSDVVIVGGAAAVSGDVYDWLQTTGGYNVSRVFGNTRYETSAEVALEIENVVGAGDPGGMAMFARGDSFPDALAAAPIAYARAVPILLVKPSSAPQAILDAIDDLDIDEGYVLGGEAAILNTTKATIDTEIMDNGGAASERWSGDNRYETAAIVAQNGVAYGLATTDYVGIATGTNFPDALAGGVTAGQYGGVLLLTKSTSLPIDTDDFLSAYGDAIVYAQVYGGTSAVSDAVHTAILAALGW